MSILVFYIFEFNFFLSSSLSSFASLPLLLRPPLLFLSSSFFSSFSPPAPHFCPRASIHTPSWDSALVGSLPSKVHRFLSLLGIFSVTWGLGECACFSICNTSSSGHFSTYHIVYLLTDPCWCVWWLILSPCLFSLLVALRSFEAIKASSYSPPPNSFVFLFCQLPQQASQRSRLFFHWPFLPYVLEQCLIILFILISGAIALYSSTWLC